MTSAINQRRHPRIPRVESLSLTIMNTDSIDPERLFVSSRDVSLSGISVSLPAPIKPNTDVEIWVALLQERATYHLYGTVAWCAAPDGELIAGIALDLERADGRLWSSLFNS